MYRKYRDTLFHIRYLYRGKKYRDVPVHQGIVAGLVGLRGMRPIRQTSVKFDAKEKYFMYEGKLQCNATPALTEHQTCLDPFNAT